MMSADFDLHVASSMFVLTCCQQCTQIINYMDKVDCKKGYM